jgi:nicotinate-nucleotide pyrophosphorylase
MFSYTEPTYVRAFIQSALREDIGEGDHTSLSTVPADAVGTAELKVKDRGVLAGVELAQAIFTEVDASLTGSGFYHRWSLDRTRTSSFRGKRILSIHFKSRAFSP